MYSRILCPIDGSETANAGLDEAIRLAQQQRASIRLLYVLDIIYLENSGYMIGEVYDQLRGAGLQILETAKSKVAAANVPVETVLADATAHRIADVVVDECRNTHADLIVMGTHGRRGISHLFLGSDAEAVIRMAEVPVLLVKARTK